ncbi:MAG: hypothetical protein KDD52_08390 [Bdellovibrionales bacterium]|nr:hypothetical protein [Bdellovibrionales bacterium]
MQLKFKTIRGIAMMSLQHSNLRNPKKMIVVGRVNINVFRTWLSTLVVQNSQRRSTPSTMKWTS